MPRDLADVLHYFMPELDDGTKAPEDVPTRRRDLGSSVSETRASETRAARAATTQPEMPPLSIVGLPIGERDVVRAALAWNLAVETARLGDAAVMLAPDSPDASPLWPEAGIGPLGTELVLSEATNLDTLCDAAHELADSRAARTRHRGVVFVRVPPAWLASSEPPARPIRWWLLLTSAHRRELNHAYEIARTLVSVDSGARIGATVHGVSAIAEARTAFEHLARRSEEGLGLALRSYGLLVDDLHVYRAIAAQRPIGLEHPQAPATRALMDVARLLEEDARTCEFG